MSVVRPASPTAKDGGSKGAQPGRGRLMALRPGDDLDPGPSLGNTTMHGLNHALGSPSPARQSVWCVLLSAALFAVVVVVSNKTALFMTSPSNTLVTLEPNERLRFPAVTVCNNQRFSATRARGGPFQKTVQHGVPPGRFTLAEARAAGFTAGDLFLQCRFNFRRCDPEQFTYVWNPEFGNCYTFNGDEARFSLLDPFTNQTYWHDSANPLYADRAGKSAGLEVIFNAQVNEYPTADFNSTYDSLSLLYAGADTVGIRYAVHNQRDPFTSAISSLAPPGTTTLLEVEKSTEQRLPHPYGTCKVKPEGYSVPECAEEFLNNATRALGEDACSWLPPFDVTDPIPCFSSTTGLVTAMALASAPGKTVGCPNPCHEVSFRAARRSLGLYPSPAVTDIFADQLNVSNAYVSQNVGKLAVGFASLNVVRTNTTIAYDFVSLISDYGGQLGLFAGVSFLTLIEIAEGCCHRTGAEGYCLRCCGCRKAGASQMMKRRPLLASPRHATTTKKRPQKGGRGESAVTVNPLAK